MQARGGRGGAWGQCIHLRNYGLNVDFGLAAELASLRPRSSLEFGCGLGLYTGFLHQVAGTRRALGIEPNAMPFAGFRGAQQLRADLVVNVSAAAGACESQLGSFDLVFSIEVAEHLPPALHGKMAALLARHTHGFLVFSAGRPGQPGVGHIGNRPQAEWEREFTSRGLVPLPRTRHRLSGVARNTEHRQNLLAFAGPGAPLGLWHDEPDGSLTFRTATEQRKRPGFPPETLAHLVDAACRKVVKRDVEHGNADGCNATHGVNLGSHYHGKQTVQLPESLAPGGRVPWLARHRLRAGELALWPELVIEHARCYEYRKPIRDQLVSALNISALEPVRYH